MTKLSSTGASVWTAILAATALFGSYAFACVFPFAAIATIAALTLDARRGVALVALVWAANQAVGFGLHAYPHDASTIGWGIAIGVGALGAYAAARSLVGDTALLSVRALGGLLAALVAYEGLLFAYALVAGGTETFAPGIVARIALNDAAWFAGLAALRLLAGGVIVRAAVPGTVR